MNKKDDFLTEDKYKRKSSITNKCLLISLILLFFFTLYISIQYIMKYQEVKKPKENEEIIEIVTKESTGNIINNGIISEKITHDSFASKDEIVVENINIIKVRANEDKSSNIKFDVKYNIIKNDFFENLIPTNNSEVLVRFSYSFDNKNWTYINNVISTNSSNISPLVGNNYDIAGLITNLKVATNFELATTNSRKDAVMYWRSETIFNNLNNYINDKELEANFTIEYKSF